MAKPESAPKPDFRLGYAVKGLADGAVIAGRVDAEDAILVRRGDEFFVVGASCTHYHGPLVDGLVVGNTVRCPWHHACFDLRTGEALRAPALDPIPCWRTERSGDNVFARESVVAQARRSVPSISGPGGTPTSVLIIGGGAAGLAAADTLRREGFQGPVTILSADDSPPCDRPNLSKDFLVGTAPADWIPLRSPEYYTKNQIDMRLRTRVSSIDLRQKRVLLETGDALEFAALLIATGAEPVRLDIPGAMDSQLHYLRTFADSQSIVTKAGSAKRVVVVGTSFIGLEVAASLRARGIEVHVVGPDAVPLERVLGREVGSTVRDLHEAHGVAFHLGATVKRLDGSRVTLSDSTQLEADFVVLGVGVRPSIVLAEQAGLTIDRGVAVDAYLQTSAPGVFAAGDIARWPDPHSGERIRVEHWVVAQRQGQVAARNILGQRQQFDAVPFFWSQHYDVAINYVGHSQAWDSIAIDGTLASHDCTVSYKQGGRTLAVATISRDLQSLQAELAFELDDR